MTDQSANMIGLRGWDSPDNMPNMMEYHNVAGLASPQMYILLAECYVRGGDIDKGMDQLDHLRKFRLPADAYAPLKGTVADEAAADADLLAAKAELSALVADESAAEAEFEAATAELCAVLAELAAEAAAFCAAVA